MNTDEAIQFSATPTRAARSVSTVGAIGAVLLIVTSCSYAVWTATAGELSIFGNVSSVLLVVATPFLILSAIYGWAAPIDAIGYVFLRRKSTATAHEAAQLFQLWALFALCCGFIATMVGLVVMLARLNDPSQIGTGLAVALLSQLYGICGALACMICSAVVMRRYPKPDRADRLARKAVSTAAICVVGGTITTLIAFGILLLAFRV